MCGINGFNYVDNEKIESMNKEIKHRGPDDDGIFIDNNISLGQVRLSILDLSKAGHQPMFYSKKYGACSEKYKAAQIKNSNLCIVFNGEIYNYIEIKNKLKDKGYKFTTETDTEVILASYLEWGQNCVEKFNGMWAFCIYDKKNKILFCSRDRLGVKPLYYYFKDGKFIFSSELKGILVHKKLEINRKGNINKEGVELYFALGFIPSPYSIYKNVFKLEARQNLIFDLKKNKISKKWEYYEIPDYKPINDKKKLINEGKKILKDAVKIRMRSDVPVGAFLSGGLDSSTVVAVMKDFTDLSKLHTFSIGFDGKYDETKYVKIIKDHFKTIHHHEYFRKKDFENIIDKYSEVYDEPFGDYSGFPTYVVSKLARKNVTVSLSGDGGDEIFGGYMNHLTGSRMDFIRKIPKILRQLGSKVPVKKNLNTFASIYLLKEALKLSLNKKSEFYSKALEYDAIKPKVYKKWTKKNLEYSLDKGENKLGEALRINDLLFNSLADQFLVKVDRASMAYALEIRSPFLDYRFAEFAQKIPTKWKQNLFRTKILMRDIIKDILPKTIVNRSKWGFTPPLEEWLLDKKYIYELNKSLNLVKDIDLDIYNFFKNKVCIENNRFYTQYNIRLFLYGRWYKKWVK